MSTEKALTDEATDSSRSSSRQISLICLDDDGRVAYANGLGNSSALRALASDQEWTAEMARKRMSGLALNGRKLMLIWAPMQTGAMLAIHEDPGETVFDFVTAVDFAFDIFEHLLSNPYDGMTVIDADAIVRFISPVHEAFFNHQPGEAIGKPVEKVIENTRLHTILKSRRPEIGHTQKMRGANRIVSRTPIFRDEQLMGAIGRVMFKGPEQVAELSQRIKSLENEVDFYRREAEAVRRNDNGIDSLLGNSSRMQDLRKDIIRVAPLDVPVMLMGESGVGKELVAQALHRLSSRRVNTIVMVNAAALPATLVESELFGYSSGAFTGGRQQGHSGKFEQANHGTLFMDEIGDMPLEVQAKLLRVLQDGVIDKLGSTKPVNVDFRLITATNRNIEEMIEQNSFRLDLYYRISPVVLRVPPLRERLEDIPMLAEHFLIDFAKRHGRKPCQMDPAAIDWLMTQSWPGNVRQLKHDLERAAIFDTDGMITPADFTNKLSGNGVNSDAVDPLVGPVENSPGVTMTEQMARLETRLIAQAMQRHGGNKKKVAEDLGVSRTYLYKKLAQIESL